MILKTTNGICSKTIKTFPNWIHMRYILKFQIQVSAAQPITIPQSGTPVKVQNTMTKISTPSQIVLPNVSTASVTIKSPPDELSSSGVVDEIPPVSHAANRRLFY